MGVLTREPDYMANHCCLSCCKAGDNGGHDYCVDCDSNPACPSGGRADYFDHTPATLTKVDKQAPAKKDEVSNKSVEEQPKK